MDLELVNRKDDGYPNNFASSTINKMIKNSFKSHTKKIRSIYRKMKGWK